MNGNWEARKETTVERTVAERPRTARGSQSSRSAEGSWVGEGVKTTIESIQLDNMDRPLVRHG